MRVRILGRLNYGTLEYRSQCKEGIRKIRIGCDFKVSKEPWMMQRRIPDYASGRLSLKATAFKYGGIEPNSLWYTMVRLPGFSTNWEVRRQIELVG
jgi:hypothetical protein